ncbi:MULTISPECIES: protein DpdI [Pseudomonas]|uniref:Uncharacterized protein n=1 Tax=Pseudomonas fluorescens TaxID=294 RepID=A0A161XH88_PSEFL|nr:MULTISPECIES: protein DpdI [Pseudomonas]KZN21248.1 hypothetical protein A1D17_02130 [Pseudomonas fluorescens]
MLLGDARSVHERLVRAQSARSDIDEAETLGVKRNELQRLADRIVILARRKAFLQLENVPISPVHDIDKAKQLISQNRARFAELPKSTTLVGNQRWSKLLSTLTEFSASTETLQKQDWKDYFSSKLFGGLPPEQRKQTILQALPSNQKALELYTRLYQRFNQYRNTIPSTLEELREILECSKGLPSIQFKENDDVPVPVRAFFDATSLGGGASLDFLTSEVIEWLRKNNMLVNFVVRAR